MITAVLVDDEKNALEMLEWQLKTYCPEITVVAICQSADDGIAAILKYQPQLLFLDVEMPYKNGFELLKEFPDPWFEVIFTTAYNQFAIQAFRFAAFDYLLKPIDADDLIKTVNRFVKKQTPVSINEQMSMLLSRFNKPEELPEKVGFSTQQAVHFIKPSQIVYCESDSNYTRLYMVDDTKMVITKTLKEVEEMLLPYQFLRIHQSFLVNRHEVSRYIKTDGGTIEMSNGAQLPISRQKKEQVLQALNM